MLEVSYPALPSCFLNENAILRRYKFWSTLKCFFTEQCYPYPIVYTDGLISQIVKDGETRTPWGIAIGDYIMPLQAPEEEMPLNKAYKYCHQIEFAGRNCSLMSMETLRYIRSNKRSFNKMLKVLGGTPFVDGIYATNTRENDAILGITFIAGLNVYYWLTPTDGIICRPAINISDLY